MNAKLSLKLTLIVQKRETAVGMSSRVLGSVTMQCGSIISQCKTVSEAITLISAKERDCCWNELLGFRVSDHAMWFHHQSMQNWFKYLKLKTVFMQL